MSISSSGSRSQVPGLSIIALATWEKEECGFESLVLWEMRVVVQSRGRGPSNVAASGIPGEMAGKCFSVEPETVASDVCFEAISSPGFR